MTATAAPTEAPVAAARTNRGTLEHLTIRRRTTGEEAAERAKFMRRMRIVLPVLAVILIAAFFLSTRKGGGDNAFLDDFAEVQTTTRNLSSAKPQFSGVDSSGNPYEITAETMSQKAERKEIVELESPRAVTKGADRESVVAARAGVFNTDDKRLQLENGVTFERAIGRDNYVLKTPAATVSIDEQTVVSDKGVDGAGPGGSTIKADRMNADNRSGTVVFEGNVSMRIYPKEVEKAADAPEAAQEPENGDIE